MTVVYARNPDLSELSCSEYTYRFTGGQCDVLPEHVADVLTRFTAEVTADSPVSPVQE